MAFRVTNIQTTLQFIDQITKQRQDVDRARQEVGTGIKVANPSDDPARAATISQFQSTIQRLDRHKQRIGSSIGLLESQESIVSGAESLVLRAQELAAQGANGVMSTSARAALAEEVFEIRDALVGLANSQYQGRYIYGGAQDDERPFQEDPTGYTVPAAPSEAQKRYVFTTDDGADVTRSVQISDSDTVRITTSGDNVFSNAIAAVEQLGRALAGYNTDPAQTAYTFPDDYDQQTRQIRETIDLLSSARTNDLSPELTSIGSRLNRMTQSRDIIEAISLSTEQARSVVQDVDVFEAATRLSNLQLALEGLLTSGSRINDLTLLNFL